MTVSCRCRQCYFAAVDIEVCRRIIFNKIPAVKVVSYCEICQRPFGKYGSILVKSSRVCNYLRSARYKPADESVARSRGIR
jgi:hypothetical protein